MLSRGQSLLRDFLASGPERSLPDSGASGPAPTGGNFFEAPPTNVVLEGPVAASVVTDYVRHASVYRGNALLFRTADRAEPLFYPAVWDLGWRGLVSDLEIQAVPSTHLDMLRVPAVLSLARRLDRAFGE
jgi:hypothetical protein